MKILKHGNVYNHQMASIECQCSKCKCVVSVEEYELEGNSSRFCWCPECRETIWIPEREICKALEVVAVDRIKNNI